MKYAQRNPSLLWTSYSTFPPKFHSRTYSNWKMGKAKQRAHCGPKWLQVCWCKTLLLMRGRNFHKVIRDTFWLRSWHLNFHRTSERPHNVFHKSGERLVGRTTIVYFVNCIIKSLSLYAQRSFLLEVIGECFPLFSIILNNIMWINYIFK